MRLKSSGIEFDASERKSECHVDFKNLPNIDMSIFDNYGFCVIRDVLSSNEINKIRDNYYSAFNPENYYKKGNKWFHLSECNDSHGKGNHPAREFVKSKEFLAFISQSKLVRVAEAFIKAKKPFMFPRAIIRSFSKISTRCTYAHRDFEYINVNDPNQVISMWLPLGPADHLHGQLVYLEESHENPVSQVIKKELQSKKVLGKDLGKISLKLGKKWIIPKVNIGDIVVHNLLTLHASFDSKSIVPRLSTDIRFSVNRDNADFRWMNHWSGDDGF